MGICNQDYLRLGTGDQDVIGKSMRMASRGISGE